MKARKLVDTHIYTPTLIQSVILILYLNLAGTTAVQAVTGHGQSAVAGGKDRRHLNGQAMRQHPYPRT